ncbi:hypothetical protein SCHPADRAFT_662504 [Schizopora paradoxa]|uniref:Uncharacterized protein n=1 Tax=Schizopora paradoxa TaxID=27342 RepID=A0A0H2RCC5_9AGAM|nr:hypothetical protein SCHPADRAFT_662504 [Schizopora paradoxa]
MENLVPGPRSRHSETMRAQRCYSWGNNRVCSTLKLLSQACCAATQNSEIVQPCSSHVQDRQLISGGCQPWKRTGKMDIQSLWRRSKILHPNTSGEMTSYSGNVQLTLSVEDAFRHFIPFCTVDRTFRIMSTKRNGVDQRHTRRKDTGFCDEEA